MSKLLAIKAENISKQYRLGQVGTGTIVHDLNRWWASLKGKEDPYLKIGEINDRTHKGDTDYVWSLKNINFEIEKGEAVGIIGRNGAGKSTLLKLLSKVTKPTTGNFKINGRIASLLEVGTGFNPEMTGRENIFLNGAILGMTRREIRRKFDEIVDFSGCERYIDTPVKRYSSGMYVRLAFAVAAYLESEILIVDEVLAVGDAEFQKKCLGKMGDVSKGEGRTVLFVSHNMAAVEKLCTSGIFLKNGMIDLIGSTKQVVEHYLNTGVKDTFGSREWNEEEAPGNQNIKIVGFDIKGHKNELLDTTSGFDLSFVIRNFKKETTVGFNAKILNQYDSVMFTMVQPLAQGDSKDGIYKINISIPYPLLNQGFYKIKVWFGEKGVLIADFDENLFQFEIIPKITKNNVNPDRLPGAVIPEIEYHIDFL
ncbi:ABC transporter ATP-binding protein [Apibacter raozihei]|uniref:ABC transporter ATP-binding protein n=1 Tax=Apibacter raozihei TaxID=2500547 RepID=UPI000FE32CFA|nr:ABC transporter ATP-binding protein [Apibacter raozihei]